MIANLFTLVFVSDLDIITVESFFNTQPRPNIIIRRNSSSSKVVRPVLNRFLRLRSIQMHVSIFDLSFHRISVILRSI